MKRKLFKNSDFVSIILIITQLTKTFLERIEKLFPRLYNYNMETEKIVLKSGREYYPLVARIVLLSISLDIVYLAVVLTLSSTAFNLDQRPGVLWLFIILLLMKYLIQTILILKIVHNWAVAELNKNSERG